MCSWRGRCARASTTAAWRTGQRLPGLRAILAQALKINADTVRAVLPAPGARGHDRKPAGQRHLRHRPPRTSAQPPARSRRSAAREARQTGTIPRGRGRCCTSSPSTPQPPNRRRSTGAYAHPDCHAGADARKDRSRAPRARPRFRAPAGCAAPVGRAPSSARDCWTQRSWSCTGCTSSPARRRCRPRWTARGSRAGRESASSQSSSGPKPRRLRRQSLPHGAGDLARPAPASAPALIGIARCVGRRVRWRAARTGTLWSIAGWRWRGVR